MMNSVFNMLRRVSNSQLEKATGTSVYRWGAEQRFHVREMNLTIPFFDYHLVFVQVFFSSIDTSTPTVLQ